MANYRTRSVKKSEYNIKRHAFLAVKHYCLNYWEWRKEHDTMIGLSSGGNNTGGGIGDPTASQAIRLSELSYKIKLVEETVMAVEPSIYEYLLCYVTTEDMTFDKLKAKGMACERDMFYDRRRKFYWLMSKKLKV